VTIRYRFICDLCGITTEVEPARQYVSKRPGPLAQYTLATAEQSLPRDWQMVSAATFTAYCPACATARQFGENLDGR